jgi:hypothetical protein
VAKYNVSVDLSALYEANGVIAKAIFGNVATAVNAVAHEGAYQWKDSVNKAALWSGEKKPYIKSINVVNTGDFSAEIVSYYKYAAEIETGRPPKDLKRMLQTSQKTRISKKGNKYLIIPFRHNVPGKNAHAMDMPLSVYAAAKKLHPSYVLPLGSMKPPQRLSASGHMVKQDSYQWSGRLPAGLMPKLKDHHKTDIYDSMVKFDTSTPKAKSSAYMTFRVMSDKSSGWIVSAKPGLYLAKNVADKLQPLLEDAIGGAVTLKSLKI